MHAVEHHAIGTVEVLPISTLDLLVRSVSSNVENGVERVILITVAGHVELSLHTHAVSQCCIECHIEASMLLKRPLDAASAMPSCSRSELSPTVLKPLPLRLPAKVNASLDFKRAIM